MGLQFWFFPVASGDFRLEAIEGDSEHVRLTVEDPTDADRKLLTPFFKTLVEMGTLSGVPHARIAMFGLTEIKIPGTIEEIGPLLAGHVHADSKLWTAVRHVSGKITVNDGARWSALEAPAPQGDQLPAIRPDTSPVAAATVREPVRGCPPPELTNRRASQVLRTFSTRAQWNQWQDHGAMKVIGNRTGKAYWLHHRNSAVAHGLKHLLIEASSRREICVWDDRVPAEEEALALKLAVEYREDWVNERVGPMPAFNLP
jgi:hypothetical protein